MSKPMTKKTNREKAICRCPCCGGYVLQNRKAYYCENFKSDPKCVFAVWKTVRGIDITEDDIIDLTTRGITFSKDVVIDDIPCSVMLKYDKDTNSIIVQKY